MNPNEDSQMQRTHFTDINEFVSALKSQEMYSDLMVKLGAGKPEQEFFYQDVDSRPDWY